MGTNDHQHRIIILYILLVQDSMCMLKLGHKNNILSPLLVNGLDMGPG